MIVIIEYIHCYFQSKRPLTRFTASSFFRLTILAYTCVMRTSVCPSSLLVVYRSAPSVSIMVAKVCREDKINEYAIQLNKLIHYYESHPNRPLISQFVHDLNVYARCIDSPTKQLEICGAGNGFQVFDTDGLSYPCHILSPLVLQGQKLEQIKEGLLANTTDFSDKDCERCPYVSSCPTCIACNYLYRNNLTKRDKTHCEIMKLEVKAFIKKEILRLSKKDNLSSKDATVIDSIKKLIQ